MINTKYDGVYQIYNALRKKLGPDDEEKAEARSMSAHDQDESAPAKSTPLKDARDDSDKDADAVKIEARGFPKGFDEKNVPYRKRRPSPPKSSDKPISESSRSRQSLLGEVAPTKFAKLKQQFNDLLDAYDEDKFGGIIFEVQFSHHGVHITHRDFGEPTKP